MAIIKYLKNRFGKKRSTQQPVEYIQEKPQETETDNDRARTTTELRELDNEIDLSSHHDLEDYARGLSVTKESIERWISSGLLMPEEMKVAEKLLKIMRRRDG